MCRACSSRVRRIEPNAFENDGAARSGDPAEAPLTSAVYVVKTIGVIGGAVPTGVPTAGAFSYPDEGTPGYPASNAPPPGCAMITDGFGAGRQRAGGGAAAARAVCE